MVIFVADDRLEDVVEDFSWEFDEYRSCRLVFVRFDRRCGNILASLEGSARLCFISDFPVILKMTQFSRFKCGFHDVSRTCASGDRGGRKKAGQAIVNRRRERKKLTSARRWGARAGGVLINTGINGVAVAIVEGDRSEWLFYYFDRRN